MSIPVKQLRDLSLVSDITALSAYKGTLTTMLLANGNSYIYSSSSTLTPVGKFIVSATGKGSGRWLLITDVVNVADFGAVGDGINNDLPACQAAVNYVKALTNPSTSGQVRPVIQFTKSQYRFNSTTGGLDCTNSNGIVLFGGLGKYLTTQITGNCKNAIFDFTGSSASGCSGFAFFSDPSETNPAQIGVLFALGQGTNGLYNYIQNCWFQMTSQPTMNGGMGTVGIMNVRSEEFHIIGCTIRANSPIVLSSSNVITTRHASVTVASAYGTVSTGTVSMGLTFIVGTTLGSYAGIGHALTLNGTNNVRFAGYMSGEDTTPTNGASRENAAIGFYNYHQSLTLSGTIEGFSSIAYLGSNARWYQSQTRLSYANIIDITKPVIELHGTTNLISGSEVGVTFGNGSAEMGTRTFIYAPPVSSGDAPTTSSIINSTISVPDWGDNTKIVTPAILKQCSNVLFNINQAFEKKGNYINYLLNHPVLVGTDNSTNAGTVTGKILRFNLADKATTTSSDGGYYSIKIQGVIDIGGYGPCSSAEFISTIHIHQTTEGIQRGVIQNTTIEANLNQYPSYAAIANISAGITLSGSIASINITVTTTGSHPGEPINFTGKVSLLSNFLVNQSVLFD